jgi:hypothetical protein
LHFFLSFLDFLVKRLGGVTCCLDGAPGCPDGGSGCPDDTVVSSGRSFRLFLVLFVVLCIFPVLFMRNSQVHMSSLQFISTPVMFLIFFY